MTDSIRLGVTAPNKMIFPKFVQPITNWWYRKHPPEMVEWWKTKEKVRAKRIRTKDGDYQMLLEGEKYPQPNYPRGYILFGQMSKLKHVIKNEIFNRTWYDLERGDSNEAVVKNLKDQVLPLIFNLMEDSRYDFLPPQSLSKPIKELWRAWSTIETKLNGERRLRAQKLKEIVCFILQEDDAYRFRFQWICGFFNPNAWWRKIFRRSWEKDFDFALSLLEHAEVVGDMKERQRLFKRVILAILKDPETRESFELLMKELDWKKLRLSKADKYYFRGKYFKVDYPNYSY